MRRKERREQIAAGVVNEALSAAHMSSRMEMEQLREIQLQNERRAMENEHLRLDLEKRKDQQTETNQALRDQIAFVLSFPAMPDQVVNDYRCSTMDFTKGWEAAVYAIKEHLKRMRARNTTSEEADHADQ